MTLTPPLPPPPPPPGGSVGPNERYKLTDREKKSTFQMCIAENDVHQMCTFTLDQYGVGEYKLSNDARTQLFVTDVANFIRQTELALTAQGITDPVLVGPGGEFRIGHSPPPVSDTFNARQGCRILAMTSWGSADAIKMDQNRPLVWSGVPAYCRISDQSTSLSNADLASVRHCIVRQLVSERLGGDLDIIPKDWKTEIQDYTPTGQRGGEYRGVGIKIERSGMCQ